MARSLACLPLECKRCTLTDMASLMEIASGRMAREVKEGLRPVIDLVYPPRCPSCGTAIATHGALCLECWEQLEFASGNDEPEGERHSGIIAATHYNDMSRALVLKFKHGGKLALAPLLGKMIAARIPDHGGEEPIIIPVPLHRTRIWQRGFNQSAMLARALARAGKGELNVDALIRHKRTPSLGNLSAEKRKKALAGAIGVRAKAVASVRGRNIILVDDVLTSGATSDACVDALLEAGASKVRIACFARADRRQNTWG